MLCRNVPYWQEETIIKVEPDIFFHLLSQNDLRVQDAFDIVSKKREWNFHEFGQYE